MGVKDRAIAIVGLGCILPDAPDVDTFWQNIINKRYSISDVPPGRWGTGDYFDPDPRAPDKTYTTIGGWVNGFEFDWRRFRIPPKVAAAIDQGQQWALSISADALADYGYPDKPLNTADTAVILGTAMGGELHYQTMMRINFPEYADALESAESFQNLPASVREQIVREFHGVIDETLPHITEDSMPGELPNIVSGRVANVLDLHGPNFITDAACASSMAAVEAAIEMLTDHKVDAVIAGGVDRNMGIGSFVKFCKIGALSATGTRPFGAGADGFVMGEGAAVFLLKRLEDAERSGDTNLRRHSRRRRRQRRQRQRHHRPQPDWPEVSHATRMGYRWTRSSDCWPDRSARHEHERRRRRRIAIAGRNFQQSAAPQHRARLGQEQYRPPQSGCRRSRYVQSNAGAVPQSAAAIAQCRNAQSQFRL